LHKIQAKFFALQSIQGKPDIHPGQKTLRDEYKRVSSVQHFPPR